MNCILEPKFPIIASYTDSRVLYLRSLGKGILWKTAKCFPSNIYNFALEEKIMQHRSDQISRSVVPDSLRPHESQHARPPCPSPTPGVHSDSHPSSQ